MKTESEVSWAYVCNYLPHKGFSHDDVQKEIVRSAERLHTACAGTKVIALGEWAFTALTGKSKLDKWYGMWHHPGDIMPNFAPWQIVKKAALRPVFFRIFARAFGLTNEPNNWPAYQVAGPYYSAFERLAKASFLAVDIENVPDTGWIRCIGVASTDFGVSFPMPPEGDSTFDEANELRKLLASPIPKVLHYGQFDLIELPKQGFEIGGPIHDTLLQHAILAPRLSHKLTHIGGYELNLERWKSAFKADDDEKQSAIFEKSPIYDLQVYNVKDSIGTALIYERFTKQLHDVHNGVQLYEAARQLDALAIKMRKRGIRVEYNNFAHHDADLSAILAGLRKDWADKLCIPEKYTLGANGQNTSISMCFFKAFNLQPLVYTDKGAPALNTFTLEKFASLEGLPGEAARLVLSYRKHTKLLSAYIRNLPVEQDGCVHPTWKVFGTRTGRWSATQPAIQTIPKPKKRKDGQIIPGMRDLFCARAGMVLAEADYSQLELRIVALLSGDSLLLQWYADNQDVHTLNAKATFQTETPDPKLRDLAKTVVYALNYGGSIDTIHQSLSASYPGLPRTNVERVVNSWFNQHPAIYDWQQNTKALAEKRLFVEAPISGRRQFYHDGQIEPTEVLNFPIQATAGDIMNESILGLDRLMDWEVNSILMQVHDAAVVEGKEPAILVDMLRQSMEREVTLAGKTMLFPIDVKVGKNWGHMEKLHA